MRRVSCMAICLAGLGTVACLPGWAAEPKQLPIGEVLSRPLTGQGADELVRIRGVVTWSCPGHETFTIEDVSGGIWVNCFYDEAVQAWPIPEEQRRLPACRGRLPLHGHDILVPLPACSWAHVPRR